MSDPALEAARRANLEWAPRSAQPILQMIDAAREALKPIRELFDRYHDEVVHREEVWKLLDELAPLIYSEDEL